MKFSRFFALLELFASLSCEAFLVYLISTSLSRVFFDSFQLSSSRLERLALLRQLLYLTTFSLSCQQLFSGLFLQCRCRRRVHVTACLYYQTFLPLSISFLYLFSLIWKYCSESLVIRVPARNSVAIMLSSYIL